MTVPVGAKGEPITGRLWNYVRDDRPFGRNDPPSVIFQYSRDRRGVHPKRHLAQWSGTVQADAYAGKNELYAPNREPGPIFEADCFTHSRRKFFELADVKGTAREKGRRKKVCMVYPIALEALQKLNAMFAIERGIRGRSPAERHALRQAFRALLMAELHNWPNIQLSQISHNHDLAKAIK